jgi:PAS domain S-box-containing protein
MMIEFIVLVLLLGSFYFALSLYRSKLSKSEAKTWALQQRFDVLADSAPVLIWISGTDKLCTYFNKRWLDFTGRALEEEIGNGWTKGVHPEDHQRCLATYVSAFDRRAPFEMEYRLRRADGQFRILYDTGSPILTNGTFLGYIGSCIDITDRREMEDALRKSEGELRWSQNDLQKLASRLITAQEEQMRQLARDLHDDLTQKLAVLAIDAGILEKKCSTSPPEVHQKLVEIKKKLIKVSEDVHNLSRQLHPSIIDDLGLAQAIDSECFTFTQTTGIAVSFSPQNVPNPIPKDIALCIYRVIQECLRNVARHSKAPEAHISLVGHPDGIRLSIRDSGIGFDMNEVKQKAGLGFTGMRERVRLARGTLSIRSQPEKGTVVKVLIPVPEEKHEEAADSTRR